jgi:hypothetical protein
MYVPASGDLRRCSSVAHDERARLLGQLAEFTERIGRIERALGEPDRRENGALGVNLDGCTFFRCGHATL